MCYITTKIKYIIVLNYDDFVFFTLKCLWEKMSYIRNKMSYFINQMFAFCLVFIHTCMKEYVFYV